ncbi:hypothetical protein R1flu_018055 [Riccia fluitans]|uniref:Plastocyanin-like domain-containing protein n=1 Tax=Riccia fluitans TaxID=41844 RepID=A0ABD1ZFS6_9MARC
MSTSDHPGTVTFHYHCHLLTEQNGFNKIQTGKLLLHDGQNPDCMGFKFPAPNTTVSVRPGVGNFMLQIFKWERFQFPTNSECRHFLVCFSSRELSN